MKRCTKCGEEKPIADFYWNSQRHAPVSRCKSCISASESMARSRDKWNHSEGKKRGDKKYACSELGKYVISNRTKKVYDCAKALCPQLPSNRVVKLVCKWCGKEYGLPLRAFNSKMGLTERYHPKYCSRECQWASSKKSVNQKQSPYAKKIKELQKEYK